ncbi:MAG TPA: hypothetical protein PKD18_01290, partial [Saprospiraceae bacterium]|nr:hypothetical protein [Saprospiraceae bacterium]
MKVARWISLFTIIATLSCNSPYLQIETGSNSIYSVLGYFTKDMVKVELLVNNNFNENIDLLNKTEIKTAQIYLIDSLRNQKVLIPYNENKSFYYLDGLILERSNKYMLEIEGADMVAKTSFVQLPNPLELVEFTKDMEVNKNKLAMEVSLSWNPKGEECIESQV